LDRATDSDSVGRWFESSQARHDWVTKNVTQFFLVFMRIFGLLGTKSDKRFYRRYPTSKPQLNPPQRGFRLIFQVGSPAFLHFPTFFPLSEVQKFPAVS
jgi:hypothetical protein